MQQTQMRLENTGVRFMTDHESLPRSAARSIKKTWHDWRAVGQRMPRSWWNSGDPCSLRAQASPARCGNGLKHPALAQLGHRQVMEAGGARRRGRRARRRLRAAVQVLDIVFALIVKIGVCMRIRYRSLGGKTLKS